MDFSTMFSMLGQGFLVTLQIFFFTLVGALPLGVLVALGRMSKVKVISAIFRVYISIMRGTPLMLQLMFIYFAPYYIFGIKLSTEWSMGACLVAFILNYAAYFAEIYRSGIQSIPTGQYEAAEVLGYSRAQTFFKIIFPQVFKRIIPALGNEIIVLVRTPRLLLRLVLWNSLPLLAQLYLRKVCSRHSLLRRRFTGYSRSLWNLLSLASKSV